MKFSGNATVVVVHGAWADRFELAASRAPARRSRLERDCRADSCYIAERRRSRSEANDRTNSRPSGEIKGI
jgi:hypothetical protein